jgi:hypothetical protein
MIWVTRSWCNNFYKILFNKERSFLLLLSIYTKNKYDIRNIAKHCFTTTEIQMKLFWIYYCCFIKNNIFQFWTGCTRCIDSEIFSHSKQFFIFDIEFLMARQICIWVDQKLFNIINIYTAELEIGEMRIFNNQRYLFILILLIRSLLFLFSNILKRVKNSKKLGRFLGRFLSIGSLQT